MHRTRQHIIIAVALAGVPGSALAFHNGAVYDRPPGAGGGGGLFYTGSKRERGWDCTACHLDPPGRLRVTMTSQPSDLFEQQRYQPNTTYSITIAMVDPGSQLGLQATRSNFNSMAITMFDDAGAAAGTIAGFDAGKFYTRGTSILASDSTTVNETTWTFTWTAPAVASGPIAINLAVVDGNGANATTQTLTDPFGDDVFVVEVVVEDAAARSAVLWTISELSRVVTGWIVAGIF